MPDRDVVVEVLPARVHGRYLLRDGGQDSRGLVVAFHGYGMSALGMLEEVDAIPGIDAWTVVSVQGLHRFYDSRSREVVASWMTRQDRDLAIADNIAFVGEVVGRVFGSSEAAGPLVYVGFSQGTAMAYRAAAGIDHNCQGVVALGGDVPPDLADRGLASSPRVMIGRGLGDQWYGEDKVEADLQLLTNLGCEAQVVRFSGGHEWTEEFRLRCQGFLANLAGSG
ncbi:MAG: phospholipase [Thermoanaerobaculia bacterium]